MPSKKRKYNARFPAGRIKKIMQTDEEIGKVAQAVPIIIWATPRTLELFVESLLNKAMQVTMSRNAKTLHPSHLKQCVLGEARFDFLKELVQNIPDVSVAEEKEQQLMSDENSPNSSRISDTSVPRRVVREDSNSSSSCDLKVVTNDLKVVTGDNKVVTGDHKVVTGDVKVVTDDLKVVAEPKTCTTDIEMKPKNETVTSQTQTNEAIDLTKKEKPRMANFYQETLIETVHKSVIQVNPIYTSPQPSTSTFNKPQIPKLEPLLPKQKPYFLELKKNNNLPNIPIHPLTPPTPKTPVTPILNIDFTKNFAKPEIKVLDTAAANIVGVKGKKLQRQISKARAKDVKKEANKIILPPATENIGYGNLQIDEDYEK